jgi:hypothetical protein
LGWSDFEPLEVFVKRIEAERFGIVGIAKPLQKAITFGCFRSAMASTKFSFPGIGGSIVNLLLYDADFFPARPTDDVDVVLEVVTTELYSAVEERIRRLGFEHDTREGAPLCRKDQISHSPHPPPLKAQ